MKSSKRICFTMNFARFTEFNQREMSRSIFQSEFMCHEQLALVEDCVRTHSDEPQEEKFHFVPIISVLSILYESVARIECVKPDHVLPLFLRLVSSARPFPPTSERTTAKKGEEDEREEAHQFLVVFS